MIEKKCCSQQVLSPRGPGVDQIPYSRMLIDSDCSWKRCCLRPRDVSCEMTLSSNDGLYHLGMRCIKARHFQSLDYLLCLSGWFDSEKDGTVGVLAVEQSNTLSSYLNVIRIGRRFKLKWAIATAKASG